MSDVIQYAQTQNMQIVHKEEQKDRSSLQEQRLLQWIHNQMIYYRIQDIKDLIAIIEILKLNELEKNKLIFEDKTVFELVSEAYSDIVKQFELDKSKGLTREFNHKAWNESTQRLELLPERIRQILGALYHTKEINPPYFFSLSFSIGVYLPLLSPLIFPPILTFLAYLKHLKTYQPPKKKVD